MLKKDKRCSTFDCEYLVGDDSCRAIKESDVGALRAEVCLNEVEDTCCYLCSFRKGCDISCDLPELQRAREKPKNLPPPHVTMSLDTHLEMECGNCIYYLKPECPRDYSHDTELWRRQDPCETFQPAKKVSNAR